MSEWRHISLFIVSGTGSIVCAQDSMTVGSVLFAVSAALAFVAALISKG